MTFDEGGRENNQKVEEQVELIPDEQKEVTKKRRLPVWLGRPYYVWRNQFQQDKCCPKKMIKTELISASQYIIGFNTVFIGFLFLGATFIDLQYTSTLQPVESYSDRALFFFTTVSTIGYGNIVPAHNLAKVFCILYCTVGIPFFFLTLGINSMLFVDLCDIISKSFNPEITTKPGFRWYTSALLLATHCFIGSILFSQWIDEFDFLDAFYFSFISITTIGYGDFCPSPEGPLQYFVLMVYLASGVATMLLFFSSLQKVIMWIHYYGRKVSDSEEAEIWYNGQMITVKTLVKMVAEKAGSTPEKLREVLHDLDKILEVACKQAEDDPEDNIEEQSILASHQTTLTSPPGVRKKTVFLSGSSDGPDENQATIHSFTSTNQKSIPKDTEMAILALGLIQHHLRKPSVRGKHGHHHHFQRSISKPASDTHMDMKEPCTSLDLRKMAHRVHSDGKLLDI